jgi:hypothetical protein
MGYLHLLTEFSFPFPFAWLHLKMKQSSRHDLGADRVTNKWFSATRSTSVLGKQIRKLHYISSSVDRWADFGERTALRQQKHDV